jgi:hypothetical protein
MNNEATLKVSGKKRIFFSFQACFDSEVIL